MIENRIQWATTNRQIRRFRDAIEVLASVALPAGVDPAFRKIEEDAMQAVLGDLERERIDFELDTKRFFLCDDGEVSYVFVAFDLDDAQRMLRESGTEFCNPNDFGPSGLYSVPFAAATWLEWRELTREEAISRNVDTTDDARGRGTIPLVACDVGEWFGSEW